VNSSKLRRRFLALSVPALAIVLAVTGISYLASTGAVTTTVRPSSTNFIYPVVTAGRVPSALAGGLKYTPSTDIASTSTHKLTAVVNPSWSPTTNSAGSVTTAGDLAVVDASIAKHGVVVSMYITNLASLQAHYSSFDLPVTVYEKPCTTMATTGLSCTAVTGTWVAVTTAKEVKTSYVTSTVGFMTFNLAAGYLYDITIGTGGSFYCTTAPANGTGLAPNYYFTAQPY